MKLLCGCTSQWKKRRNKSKWHFCLWFVRWIESEQCYSGYAGFRPGVQAWGKAGTSRHQHKGPMHALMRSSQPPLAQSWVAQSVANECVTKLAESFQAIPAEDLESREQDIPGSISFLFLAFLFFRMNIWFTPFWGHNLRLWHTKDIMRQTAMAS